jgi:hypothetical protein
VVSTSDHPPGFENHLLLVDDTCVNRITHSNGVTDWSIFNAVISRTDILLLLLGDFLEFIEENNRISSQEMRYTNTLQKHDEMRLWFAGATALELL